MCVCVRVRDCVCVCVSSDTSTWGLEPTLLLCDLILANYTREDPIPQKVTF